MVVTYVDDPGLLYVQPISRLKYFRPMMSRIEQYCQSEPPVTSLHDGKVC